MNRFRKAYQRKNVITRFTLKRYLPTSRTRSRSRSRSRSVLSSYKNQRLQIRSLNRPQSRLSVSIRSSKLLKINNNPSHVSMFRRSKTPQTISPIMKNQPIFARSRTKIAHISIPSNAHKVSEPTSSLIQFNTLNSEIRGLASQFTKSRGKLPPINPPLRSNTDPSLSLWPENIPVYVISIDKSRQKTFLDRFKGKNVHIWQGTNGNLLDINKMIKQGKIANSSLRKGEYGCADSHIRLLKHIIEKNISQAIICEDDVDLTGDAVQSNYLNTLLQETRNIPHDILFLSWFRPDGSSLVTAHTKSQWTFCQLWAFLITNRGAKKLLNDSKVQKMHQPVDVAYYDAHSRKVVNNLVAYPPLCLTRGCASDTSRIK